MVLTRRVDQEITKEAIFQKISSYDVLHMYVPNAKLKDIICSPLRVDKHPSWSIFAIDNEILYKDWATGESGDCIRLVEKMFNLDYHKALKKIAGDFFLLNNTEEYKKIITGYSKPILTPKLYCLIQCGTKRYTAKDKAYWEQCTITPEECKRENIYSLKEDSIYVNRQRIAVTKGELAFGYYKEQGQQWKLLFPEKEKKQKWKTNIPLCTAMHLENLSKDHNSIILKSLKDYIIIQRLYPYCAYIQNESLAACPEEVAKYITDNSKKVYYSGDSDIPGKAASYKITGKYNWLHQR